MDVSRETAMPASGDLLERLRELAHAIAPAASRLGFTNYASPEGFLTHAMMPALALPAALPEPLAGDWAEIGAGSAGLGITIAVAAPTASVYLIDRRERVVAFLDVILARTGLRNARAVLADLPLRNAPEKVYDGVMLRAFPPAERGLLIAAHHTSRWVAAWHSPGVAAFDAPPPALSLLQRTPTASDGLLLSLFRLAASHECR